jgi:hypothetical protein
LFVVIFVIVGRALEESDVQKASPLVAGMVPLPAWVDAAREVEQGGIVVEIQIRPQSAIAALLLFYELSSSRPLSRLWLQLCLQL